jgi:hypothetical protein
MPDASVGNEQPAFSPSSKIHSSGNRGPSEVVTYQIRFTLSHPIDSRFLFGCSHATSSFVIDNRYAQETRRLGNQGSKIATKRHRPKNPATNQPEELPERIIPMPLATKTADRSRVKSLIRPVVSGRTFDYLARARVSVSLLARLFNLARPGRCSDAGLGQRWRMPGIQMTIDGFSKRIRGSRPRPWPWHRR